MLDLEFRPAWIQLIELLCIEIAIKMLLLGTLLGLKVCTYKGRQMDLKSIEKYPYNAIIT